MKSFTKKIAVVFLFAVVVCFTFSQQVYAKKTTTNLPEETTQKTRDIVVGYTDIYNFINPYGNIASGYMGDYLEKIKKSTNWNYRFCYGTWEECMTWLKDGTIDFLAPVLYEESRTKDYVYSSTECAMIYTALATRKDNDDLSYDNVEDYNGITIGMKKGAKANSAFIKYAKEKKISYKTVYYDNNTIMETALSGKMIDAIVIDNMNLKSNVKTLLKLGYKPTYFLTSKKNTALMDELNNVLCSIELEDPYYKENLFQKYYAINNAKGNELTREERNFVKGLKTLRVVCDRDDFPFEYFDQSTGEYKGIDIDILNRVSKESGIKIKIIKTDSMDQSWNYIKENKADILMGVFIDDYLSEIYNMNGSDSYITESFAVVYRKGSSININKQMKVALPRQFVGLSHYVKNQYPQWSIEYYDTKDKALNAVDNGEADITLVSSYTMQMTSTLLNYSNLTVYPNTSISLNLSMGISNTCDSQLKDILNKALGLITDDEKQQIITKHSLLKNEKFDLTDFIRYNPVLSGVIFVVIAVVLYILFFLSYHSRVKERETKSISEQNIKLRKANAAKSEFLSRMSHDIRTPLNAILGTVHLGLEDTKDESVKRYFGQIHTSGHYLLDILNNVLDMSKIENNKMTVNNEPSNIRETLSVVEDIIFLQTKNKSQIFNVDTSGITRQYLNIDRTRLEQVLVNLLYNAVKYTPAEGIISYECKQKELDNEIVITTHKISDTGRGMTKDFMEHMFEPFSVEGDTNSNDSVGLGLAICSNLVKAMGGTITCDSKINKGTTFIIEIKDQIISKEEYEDSIGEELIGNNEILNGKKVLVCEDNQINAIIAQRLLKKKNVISEVAEDGLVGLKMFEDKPGQYYDAILMDIRMPNMNGIETTKLIRKSRAHSYASNIPIIAISANAYEEDIKECIDAGMNAHIAKPFEPEILYSVLAKYINESEKKK